MSLCQELISVDYIDDLGQKIIQRKDMFRFNSDSISLGRFLNVKKSDRVLDIGTNNGVLLMFAKNKGASQLVGIDILDEALELATLNCPDAVFINCSINEYSDNKKFDVIVSNPPYYENSLKNKSYFLEVARQQTYCPMDDWIKGVNRNLMPNGRFYALFPTRYLQQLMVCLYQNNLAVSKFKLLFDNRSKKAKIFMFEAKRLPFKHVLFEV